MHEGTVICIINPHSVFHGRVGVLLRYVWPEMPNPAVLVRLLPDDGGSPLPCHVDELEPSTTTPTGKRGGNGRLLARPGGPKREVQ